MDFEVKRPIARKSWLKNTTRINLIYDPKISAFRQYLKKNAPQKIPHRHAAERLFYSYHIQGGLEGMDKVAQTLRHIFTTANTIISAFLELKKSRDDMWSFTLARIIVYELNFLRKGLIFIKKSSYLSKNTRKKICQCIDEFDHFFGKIKEHRDVLMHFDDYTLGSRSLKGVSQKEVDRVGLPITIDAKGCMILGNFLGPFFLSGDAKGKICEVYMGTGLPFGIDRVLRKLCIILHHCGSLNVSIASGITPVEAELIFERGI